MLFQINSAGGYISAADGIADTIAAIKDMKTVAFLDDRALGVASLVALACNDIVFRKGARMGDVRQLVTGRQGQVQELNELQVTSLSKRAAHLAEQKGHPVAVAVAMVDPDAVVVEAKDARTGADITEAVLAQIAFQRDNESPAAAFRRGTEKMLRNKKVPWN